jgi:hypothetical protein
VLGLPSSKGEVEGGVHSCAPLTPGACYTPGELSEPGGGASCVDASPARCEFAPEVAVGLQCGTEPYHLEGGAGHAGSPHGGFVGGLEEAVAVALQTLPGISGTAYSGFFVLGVLA